MDSHDLIPESEQEHNRYERVKEPDDPRRCQGNVMSGPMQGQCTLVSTPGTNYCTVHTGSFAAARLKKQEARLYNLGRYQARLEKHADHDKIKSLREEIGILRILIEDRMNACQSDVDLAINSGPIAELVMKCEKLVTSCNKIEGQLGELMDAAKAVQFAQELVEAIADEIRDPDQLNRIADLVGEAVERALAPKAR